ncbi:hypothetical protein [uncultured Sphingomonas sp.]|uniref:hypothetical protein n=1 Tax=uncultured Sphingomonas sp. TaxID=158754 RepID=UPI002637923D|nr:hypothetical protein [uncultured Sphingomonas sp.]
MKILHIIAAGALVLPAVAVAQSAPGDQPNSSAKAKKGAKHHHNMSDPAAAPTDTMATPPASDPSTMPPADTSAPAPAPTPDQKAPPHN